MRHCGYECWIRSCGCLTAPNAAWYELTACRHAGVTSAKAVGRAMGIGTVDVYVSTPEGVPGQALLTELQTVFQKSREIAVDVQGKGAGGCGGSI